MKKNQQRAVLVITYLLLAAWAGRHYLRILFPPEMKFAATELTTLDNGRKINITGEKGNVVIVSCFQTWCSDCARETPVLNELAGQLKSDKFKILYISNEPAEKIDFFRQRFPSENIQFVQYKGSMGDLGISVFPTTYLLNKKGQVVLTKLEGYDWLGEIALVKKLIDE